jgi:histone H3/H4
MYSLDADDARRQTVGGDSIFGPIEIPEAEDESTFMMPPVESPIKDPTATEGFGGLDDDNGPLDDMDDDDDHVNEPMDMPDFDTEDEADGAAEDNNTNIMEETALSRTTNPLPKRVGKRKIGKKISRHGIEYPSLPKHVVKRLATTLAKTAGASKGKIGPDTLDVMMQATDWFFEQLGDDLSAYAKHAGRKTIDESDMITLMRRFVIQSFYSVVFPFKVQMLTYDTDSGKRTPPPRHLH